MTISEKLTALRTLMRQKGLDYYFIPGGDPHQNEYLPPMWKRRDFISGFDGSNGDVLVSLKHAYVWTDGRYALQASKQLDSSLFDVFIFAQGAQNTMGEFFEALTVPVRVGVDPATINLRMASTLENALAASKGELVCLTENLIDALMPQTKFTPQPIEIQPEKFSGRSAVDKLKALRAHLHAEKTDALILNDLASIAWLLNLRGHDIPYNPFFLSYAIIQEAHFFLYLNPESLSPAVVDYLQTIGATVRKYADFYSELTGYTFASVQLDPKSCNAAMKNALQATPIKIEASPIELWKAVKTPAELKAVSEAHRFDALALVKFFCWLDKQGVGETEASIAEKLHGFRAEHPSFKSESFTTIAGYAENGAIIHYRPEAGRDKKIGRDALLLVDSGGQYLEGTTDVTRTVHLGTPTAFEKECYTRVLKGHLALKRTIFAAGTRGEHLDALARQFLWQIGLNYAHGTGHGVGAYLCVHEGPQRISTGATTTPLTAGMIVSNEPGVYLPNEFGIRIENLVSIVKHPVSGQMGDFYSFENLTLMPYAKKLIKDELLSAEDREDIKAYHEQIWQRLSPDLTGEALAWLKEAVA